jgi:hypothetical protein
MNQSVVTGTVVTVRTKRSSILLCSYVICRSMRRRSFDFEYSYATVFTTRAAYAPSGVIFCRPRYRNIHTSQAW